MIERLSCATVVLAMAIAWGPATAIAQRTTPPQPRPDNGTIPSTTSRMGRTGPTKPKPQKELDKAFTEKAAQENMSAVRLAELAETKGSILPVRKFGERVISDDTEASRELTKAATEARIAMPQSPTTQQRNEYERLSKLSGAEFDRAYTQLAIQNHLNLIDVYQHEARDGQRSQIKAYAKDTLPMLHSQLQRARQMERDTKSSKGQ